MNPRHILRVHCLYLIAALCLTAVTATAAQAKGDWRIEGANITTTKEFTVEKDGNRDFKLLTTTGSVDVEILCQEISVDDGLLYPATKTESGTALAQFLFAQCKTFFAGTLSNACQPIEPITFGSLGLLIKHKGTTYLLFEPDTGGIFGTVEFAEECPLGSTMVGGRFVLEDQNEPFSNEEVKHLLTQAPPSLFKGQFEEGTVLPNAAITFGIHPAQIHLSLWYKLSGAEAGKKWSGLAL
jgi:hypothetical protein